MEEFNRTASVVATNIQKLVQNVSSMQRMLVHVETQVRFFLFQLKWFPVLLGWGTEISAETATALHWSVGKGHCRPAQTACRCTGWRSDVAVLNFNTICFKMLQEFFTCPCFSTSERFSFEVTDSGARLQRERLQDEFTKVGPPVFWTFD